MTLAVITLAVITLAVMTLSDKQSQGGGLEEWSRGA